jgi:hypothetical protein
VSRWSRWAGALSWIAGGIETLAAYWHVILESAPLRFPDLSAIYLPWAIASFGVGLILLGGRWRLALLAGAIYGFVAAMAWLVRVGEADSLNATFMWVSSAAHAGSWLLALRGWLLPVEAARTEE